MRAADAFPRTRRPLPWMLAIFVAMVYLVPMDAANVRVHLPLASKLDRFMIVAILLVWIVCRGGEPTAWRSRRSKLFVGAMALFFGVVAFGVFGNAARTITLGQWSASIKQLGQVATMLIVPWFAMSALRIEDLRGFSTMIIGLGVVLAVGIIVESRTGYNAFFAFSSTILRPIAHVLPPATNINPQAIGADRLIVTGPSGHGLAAVSMLAISIPFALVRLCDTSDRHKWWGYALAVALMVSAAVATQKKTGVLALLAVFVFVAVYRPKQALRLLPLGLVLIGIVHLVSPGSLGTVLDFHRWFSSGGSNAHRSADLAAVWPDVLTHPVFGRGFGSIDPKLSTNFRILDDQYLGALWQTGFLGLITYLWMIVAPIVGAHRARNAQDRQLAGIAIAASAGCVAYLVVNALFDTLSFAQAPYLFFIAAAMCTVASGRVARATVPDAVASRPRDPVPALA